MRRRAVLCALAGLGSASLSGCLGNSTVQEIMETVRIDPRDGRTWEIEPVGEDAKVTYRIESEVHAFQVFYFTDQTDAEHYRTHVEQDTDGSGPTGHDDLSMTAVPNEAGVFTAERPPDGGRTSIEIEDPHVLAVDYSNYGRDLGVSAHDDRLIASVEFEVVESGPL